MALQQNVIILSGKIYATWTQKTLWRPKSLLNVPYTLYNSIYCKQTKTSTII